jgi:putative acetyltransferase
MRLLEERHEPLVFLEGDPGYYSRLGFVPGDQLGFAPPSVRIPQPAFQVATLTGYDQAKMSGALVYPDVFWRHDCVGLRPER